MRFHFRPTLRALRRRPSFLKAAVVGTILVVFLVSPMLLWQPEGVAALLALQATDTGTPDPDSPLPTPTWTPTPTSEPTTTPAASDTPLPQPTNTPVLPPTSTSPQQPTNTPLPLPTSTPLPPPINTPVPLPTSTPQRSPTKTPIIIGPAPGATLSPGQFLPTPTPFPTPVPPLFPNLTIVAAATATATNTPTSTPTPTEQPGETSPEDAGLDLALLIDNVVIASAYVWLCCGLLVLLLVAGGLVFLVQRGEGQQVKQAPTAPAAQSIPKEQPSPRAAARHKRPDQ